MTLPRILTEPLGGSPLALAAQRGEHDEWYVVRPRGSEQWREYLLGVAEGHSRRPWLEDLHDALEPQGPAEARLRRVGGGRGVVISTGQQAALFGGPLYTLIKALSALALADELERATGVPTAPVFWAATDDSDYEEANWTAVAVPGGLQRLQLPPLERTGIPMNDVPMPNVDRLIDALAQACGATIEPAMLDLVRRCYVPPATLGAAYLRHVRTLLEPLGVAVLDASHPATRRSAAPVLGAALTKSEATERALRERFDAVQRAGYTPQVEHIPTLTLVFATGANGEKRRVPLSQAAEVASAAPVESLGPNVLLRPIVERFIMPSAAYVAGPGELAYFAQLGAAARVLDLPAPLGVPRWSATIIEPRVERLLSKLGVAHEELREPNEVRSRLARAAMPSDVRSALRALRDDIEKDLQRLEETNRDPLVPSASVEGLRRSLLHRLERAERRFIAGLKRRDADVMRDVDTAAASLYPEGTRQERMLSFVPFLARYGSPLLELMRGEAGRYMSELLGVPASREARTVTERV